MKEIGINIAGALIAIGVIVGWYFFVDRKGLSILKSKRYVSRLRRKIDPIASFLKAKTSVEWSEQRGQFLYRIVFPDGNFIMLEIWLDGFNVFTPNWTPGNEKVTPGYAELLSEIGKLPGHPPSAA